MKVRKRGNSSYTDVLLRLVTQAPRSDRPLRKEWYCLPKQRPERAEEDLVRLYLSDIGKHPLLTKADEARLAQAIEEGNAARADLQKLEDKGEKLTVAKRREFRNKIREGDEATQTFIQANLR